jgi:crossover junction endodeoxyribonuclease RuvC
MFQRGVLALDLATKTGWAYGAPDGQLSFGSVRWGKAGAERALIYRTYREWLCRQLDRLDVGLVVFESAAGPMVMMGRTSIHAIKLLIGLTEITEEVCFNRVELREAMASQVRAMFLGSNPKRDVAKPMTIERCIDLGHAVEDDDEADAVALWHYQVSHLRPDLAPKFTPLFRRSVSR